jgi:DNA ligase-1
MKELKQLEVLIKELNTSNSSNDKIDVLKKYPECKEILKWTYNPFKVYNISSKNIKKMKEIEPLDISKDVTIYDVLDKLDKREITGHDAIAYVKGFIKNNPEHKDVIYLILDRNLKTRADSKLINKVWKKLVPSFEVALANKYSDYADKIDFTKEKWYSSRKLDGVRVLSIIKDGDVQFFSRKGKEFFTLEKVKEAILNCKQLNNIAKKVGGLVLDGEMCIVDENGDENFTSMIKLIRRKDFTVEKPKYKIFDILTLSDFDKETESRTLSERIKILNEYKTRKEFDGKILDPVQFTLIKDENHFAELQNEASEGGWEGLIIRKDVPYEGKRTKEMLKVKKFFDAEYKVVNAVMGPIRYIKDGKEIEEVMLSAITIKHKSYDVSVGSGFTMDFRKECFKDPSKIIGKTVTVCYFEETTNKQGTISLRFPTVKHIYNEGRDC